MTDESASNPPRDPLGGRVGLCLSGGGYRAAAFHLGTLAYLDRIGVGVRTLSTVSGGTFTGARYVIALADGETFQTFFRRYYRDLEETDLVADALDKLAHGDVCVPSGRSNLVVAAAQVYAERFFSRPVDGGGSEPRWFGELFAEDLPVSNVIFNATDFRNGTAFRFQRSARGRAPVGNYYARISPDDARRIRIADIVAASSCFPGGFEPIDFPYDFVWRGGRVPKPVALAFPEEDDTSQPVPRGRLPLMDGGVHDNQGLDAMLLANDRKGEELDLVVISDVDQPVSELYDLPPPKSPSGLRLGTIDRLARGLYVLFALSALSLGVFGILELGQPGRTAPWRLVLLYLVPLVATAAAGYGLHWLRSTVADALLPRFPVLEREAWRRLRELRWRQLVHMLVLRTTSVLSLTTSVFMHRIRRLGYDRLYEMGRFKDRLVPSFVYSLSPAKAPPEKEAAPSEPLRRVAAVAFNCPTTLWFDEPHQLPCLVAAGQATLCHAVLSHIERKHGADPNEYDAEVGRRHRELRADWERFCDDPFFALLATVANEKDERMIRDAVSPVVDGTIGPAQMSWGRFQNELPDREELY